MIVFFTATGLFLFYCACIPVKFALFARINGHTNFGAGLALFEGRYALRSARQRALGARPNRKRKHSGKRLNMHCALPAAIHAGKYLLRHTQLDQLRLQGRLSLSDAASTALICGCTRMLGGMLAPFVPNDKLNFTLQPDFSCKTSDILFCGMVCVPAGHIISAALIGAWHYLLAFRRKAHGKASD